MRKARPQPHWYQTPSRAGFAAPNRHSVGLRETCPDRGAQNLTCESLEMVKPRPVIVFQQVIPLDCEVQA